MSAEGFLLLDEVVELEDGQPACPQYFLRVPGDPGAVHQGLTVGETETDGPADAQGVALVREEADGLPSLVEDRHVGPASVPVDPRRELRGQERVGVVG